MTTQEMLQRLHDTVQQLRGRSAAQRVNLTTTPGFAALWLIPRLSRFVATRPEVDVRISAISEMIDLAKADMDLAVRYAPAELVPGGTLLFGEDVYAVCAPSLLRKGPPLREPADLRNHTLLHLDDPRAAWMDWTVWLNALGLDDLVPRGSLRLTQYEQVMDAPAPTLPGVPKVLVAVVHRCLDKDPAMRYQSAGELADELRRIHQPRRRLAAPIANTNDHWRNRVP